MDIATIIGILLGIGAIIAGFLIEHGNISSLWFPSAAIIIFGGTLGATLISFKMGTIMKMPRLAAEAFGSSKEKASAILETMCEMSERARREGLLVLERFVNENKELDPMLVKGILLIIDGSDTEAIREILETELELMERDRKTETSVFEAMGGYAPTIGVLGAVLGLIQALGNMSSPETLTASIAVAFLATLYGVGSANLIFLPIASKLKNNTKIKVLEKEMIIEGVLSIQKGVNVRTLRELLEPYVALATNKKSVKK